MTLGDGAGQASSGSGKPLLRLGVKPFSTAAIQVKVGVAGIGLDLAVPAASRLNLRVGGNFFQYNPNLVVDGINVIGNIQLRSASASVDVFPFGNAFRISPGVVFYNGNILTGRGVNTATPERVSALAITNGLITYVGPDDQTMGMCAAKEKVDLHGRPHHYMRADLGHYPPIHDAETGFSSFLKRAA